jgi:hypothetical protein
MNQNRRLDLREAVEMVEKARPMLMGALAIVRDCLAEERAALGAMGGEELFGLDPRVTASIEAIQNLELAFSHLANIDGGPLPSGFWISEAVR